MVGAAPEIAGALALGDALHQRGIVASIAHSDATYDDVLRAIDHGYQDVTHIYSGCSMVHRVQGYRVAGVVEAGLLLNELTVQVIADGKHLPSALLQLVVKCKGADGIALITDALFAAASTYVDGDVVRQANGVEAVLEDGVMKLMDRQAFAGSVATMDRLVRTMMEMAGVSLVDAVRMASTTPARIVGFGHCKGRIAPGYDADLVVLDGDLRVLDTIVMGRSNKQDADVCHREAK